MKPKRVKITAAVKLAEPTTEPRRRFSIVAYTGGPLEVDAFDVPIYVDLDGLYWNSAARPALYNHRPGKKWAVGQLDDIRITAGELHVDGFFLKSTETARQVQAMAEDGFAWQASIGADPEQLEEVRDGQSAVVNGRTAAGPCLISRRTNLGEVSFVVLGADDRTSVRITARLSKSRLRAQGKIAMTFEEWLAKMGLADASEATKAALRLEYDKLYPASTDELAAEDDVEAEDDLEAEGDEDLDAMDDEDVTAADEELPAKARKAAAGAKAKLIRAGRKALQPRDPAKVRARQLRRMAWIEKACKGHPDIEAKALEQGWSVDKARLEVLRASRAQAPTPHRGSNKINAQSVEAALLIQAGTPTDKVGKLYDQRVMNQALEPELRAASLHYLMDLTLEAAGEWYRGNRKSDGFINAALQADKKIRAAGGMTTLSMGSILENVANKTLLSAYEGVETVWNHFCAIRTASDFKAVSTYRLDATGSFRKVGADGELKHIGLSDAKYTNQLDTYGAIVSLTRQMQYNDDLGAFLALPTMLGRLAATSLEEAFFVLLLSNPNNFFHANNRNLTTGAGSAFGIAGLTLLEQKFRDQLDPNNKPILISPVKLLVPTSLKVEADNVYAEVTVNETTTADKAKPARNPHKGKFNPIVSPYLNNTNIRVFDGNNEPAAISGQSGSAYYLFADQNVRAAFAMAFLNGVQTPTVQSAETDFGKLGMQWRSFFDFGIGVEDPMAAAKANGV